MLWPDVRKAGMLGFQKAENDPHIRGGTRDRPGNITEQVIGN